METNVGERVKGNSIDAVPAELSVELHDDALLDAELQLPNDTVAQVNGVAINDAIRVLRHQHDGEVANNFPVPYTTHAAQSAALVFENGVVFFGNERQVRLYNDAVLLVLGRLFQHGTVVNGVNSKPHRSTELLIRL